MINITDRHDCCGCAACTQSCPKHCISLKEDGEGFLYPEVDTASCTNCGLCERVCPWLNSPDRLQAKEVLAVKNRDNEERMASSSGGVFIALAKKTIERGGVVFGAVFDENWEVKHTYAETLDEVKPMMGSKYMQSRIGDSFRNAEKFLKDGREVLFTGMPCQIAGLHAYLRKEYRNLLTVDLLCHGVPSPGVWRRYLDETFFRSALRAANRKNTVLSSSLNAVPVLTDIEFRDKKLHGWKNYSFVVRGIGTRRDSDRMSLNSPRGLRGIKFFEEKRLGSSLPRPKAPASGRCEIRGVKSFEEKRLLSDIYKDNPFMRGFLADVYLRPSCYRCKCKNGVSHSDLTIADYWGIERLMPDFDDDKGVGLVLLNTDKGREVFNTLDMDVRKSKLDDARPFNGGFKEEVNPHPKREKFFSLMRAGVSVERAVSYVLQVPMHRRVASKLKRLLLKFVNKVFK